MKPFPCNHSLQMTNKPNFEMKRLDPMAGEGEQLLHAEIARLNEENQKMKDRLKQVESRVGTCSLRGSCQEPSWVYHPRLKPQLMSTKEGTFESAC